MFTLVFNGQTLLSSAIGSRLHVGCSSRLSGHSRSPAIAQQRQRQHCTLQHAIDYELSRSIAHVAAFVSLFVYYSSLHHVLFDCLEVEPTVLKANFSPLRSLLFCLNIITIQALPNNTCGRPKLRPDTNSESQHGKTYTSGTCTMHLPTTRSPTFTIKAAYAHNYHRYTSTMAYPSVSLGRQAVWRWTDRKILELPTSIQSCFASGAWLRRIFEAMGSKAAVWLYRLCLESARQKRLRGEVESGREWRQCH